MTGVYAVVVGLTVTVLLLGLLVVGLLRTQAEILRRLDSLGVRLDSDDASAPLTLGPTVRNRSAKTDLTGVTPFGDPTVVSLGVGEDPVLLAFLSTTCTSCTEFWDGLDSDSMVLHNARYRVVPVTLGPDEESPSRAQKLANPGVEVLMSSDAWAAFDVPGAPYFAVVDPEAGTVIGEGSASSMDSLVTFLGDAAGDRRWDREHKLNAPDRTDADREKMIDEELKRAGLYPGDPRLHHHPEEPSE